MELCEETHGPIVHDEKNCPLCDALEEVGSLESEVETLREDIDNHECKSDEKPSSKNS